MFNLVLTIISIALVASLALAAIFYGGQLLFKKTTDAQASQFISEGMQILSALQMARATMVADMSVDASLQTLDGLVSEKYLSQMPEMFKGAGSTPVTAAYVETALKDVAVCVKINQRGMFPTPGVVSDAELSGHVFGCVTTPKPDGTYKAIYRLK